MVITNQERSKTLILPKDFLNVNMGIVPLVSLNIFSEINMDFSAFSMQWRLGAMVGPAVARIPFLFVGFSV